eukprot:1132643-Heterocapsa_arctica.AAC.1
MTTPAASSYLSNAASHARRSTSKVADEDYVGAVARLVLQLELPPHLQAVGVVHATDDSQGSSLDQLHEEIEEQSALLSAGES